MDMEATRRIMQRISRALPAWLQWRQDVLAAQSRFAGDPDTSAAARAMTELWRLNLADIGEDEANQVLDKLAIGELLAPPYGELPVWLRRESLALRPRAEDQRRELQYAAEPRYKCLHCRDTGIAHVLDPKFVREFRKRFEAMTEADFTNEDGGSWWLRAKHWFRTEHGARKVEYGVACCCSQGERRGERMQRLDQARMPVLHGILWVRDVLTAWYAEHDATEVEYWVVPDFAEAE